MGALGFLGAVAHGANAAFDEADAAIERASKKYGAVQKAGQGLLANGDMAGAAQAANEARGLFKQAYGLDLGAPVAGAPVMGTRPTNPLASMAPQAGMGASVGTPPAGLASFSPKFGDASILGKPLMPPTAPPATESYDTGRRDYGNPQSQAAIRGLLGMAPDVPKYEERDPYKEVGFFDKQGQWHTTSAAQKKPDPYHPGQIYEADGHRWLRSPDGRTQDLGRVTYAPQAPQHPQFVTVGDQVGWAYPPAPGGAAPAKPFAPVGKRPPPTGAELAAERASKKEQQQRVTAGGMVAAVVAKQFPWAGKATVDKTTGDVLLNIGAGSPASARELRRLETEGSGVYDVVKDPDGRTRLMITGTPDASWLRSQRRPAPDPKLVTDETNTRVEDKAGVKVAPKSGAASNRAKIFQWARQEAVRELQAGKRTGQVVTDAEIEAKSQQLFNHALETGFVPGGPESGGGDPAVRAILDEFKADRAARGKK